LFDHAPETKPITHEILAIDNFNPGMGHLSLDDSFAQSPGRDLGFPSPGILYAEYGRNGIAEGFDQQCQQRASAQSFPYVWRLEI
jgi:hypothetical protein